MRRRPTIAVYILASHSKRLYIGITCDLFRRMREHHRGVHSDFPARYKINRLVHYECFKRIPEAIQREKQLKGWRRQRKIALIEKGNAGWIDLWRDLWLATSPVGPRSRPFGRSAASG